MGSNPAWRANIANKGGHKRMKNFADMMKHDCASAFFAVKERIIPAVNAVIITGAAHK